MNSLARFIDHTLLKPETNQKEIELLCSQAIEFDFFGVCVNSCWVPHVFSFLKSQSSITSSRISTVSVVGFPLGAMATKAKSFEAEWAVKAGADEIDMVVNLGWIKSSDWKSVTLDIQEVVHASAGKKVKVILETHLLSQDEKIKACESVMEAGAHFVKTSTGFSGGGATLEDIQLIKSIVGDKCQIKASGGIRGLDQAKALVEAGATRLGTSSGIRLLQDQSIQGGY